jgi:hypothetical protein
LGYARIQAATSKFIKEAFKQAFPKEQSSPTLKGVLGKHKFQPNDEDCGLFAVTGVMQLVR